MADVLGTFVGRVVAAASHRARPVADDLAPSATELESEGELEESQRAR
jgi:hypothetical protein